MDVSGYKHNYENFYEKSTYHMSINKGRTMMIRFSAIVEIHDRRSNKIYNSECMMI